MDNLELRSTDDMKKMEEECKLKCIGQSNLGKYLGCFKDNDTRDLPIFIGRNLKVRDCFDKAKTIQKNDKKVLYVGL